MDRDAMIDMVYHQSGQAFVFYNHYKAQIYSDTNLCKTTFDVSYLLSNPFFSNISQIDIDTHVGFSLLLTNGNCIEHSETATVHWRERSK